jgi:HEPN domain-containing protein
VNRARDWLEQARWNLRHAEGSLGLGDYAWACFAAQQATEAALKGLHLSQGQVAWGHSILDLLAGLPEGIEVPEELMEAAKVLDKYYIPTRYPDAHPAGPAARHYTRREAEEAVRLAGEVLAFAAALVGRHDPDLPL